MMLELVSETVAQQAIMWMPVPCFAHVDLHGPQPKPNASPVFCWTVFERWLQHFGFSVQTVPALWASHFVLQYHGSDINIGALFDTVVSWIVYCDTACAKWQRIYLLSIFSWHCFSIHDVSHHCFVKSTISEYICLPKSDKMIAIFTSYLQSLFNSLSYWWAGTLDILLWWFDRIFFFRG